MSQLTVKYFSRCLVRPYSFNLVLPNDYVNDENEYTKRPVKTLFLLHGWTGDAGNWVPEQMADKYNFAIVIPNGENGFWLNGLSTGHKYQSLLGEELISYIQRQFGLAKKKEDTYIMGLSMGGYGALHTAFAYPDVFGTAVGLSSAIIVDQVATMKPGDENPVANYEYYRECFGEPSKLLESMNNPETQIKELLKNGTAIPKIYMACGTEDFLLEPNRKLHNFLEAQKVSHTYWEDKGAHDMDFWSKCVQKFLPEIFG